MSQDPYDILETVCDRDSYVQFVRALGADFADEAAKERLSPRSPYGAGANGWEHGTIDAFLEAATAWAEGAAGSDPSRWENPWRFCAQMLYMGKIYE